MIRQNEATAWDADFSYEFLRSLYISLKSQFQIQQLKDAGRVDLNDVSRRRVFIRHDLDCSVLRAYEYARFEASMGVKSTYHVMMDSPFYRLSDPQVLQWLKEISGLGHEVGLHYHAGARGMDTASPKDLEEDILRSCQELEALLKSPVESLSFHIPVASLLNGPLKVAGRVSGYAAPLFRWYLSDSRARWREGNPLQSLKAPRSHVLQILIHPIWWGEQSLRPEIRLQRFLVDILPTLGMDYSEAVELLDRHIIYRAAPLN